MNIRLDFSVNEMINRWMKGFSNIYKSQDNSNLAVYFDLHLLESIEHRLIVYDGSYLKLQSIG